jgi:hypothetical protein
MNASLFNLITYKNQESFVKIKGRNDCLTIGGYITLVKGKALAGCINHSKLQSDFDTKIKLIITMQKVFYLISFPHFGQCF